VYWEADVSKYKLYVDLDGVLVNFEKGVLQASGREVGELSPKRMWPILAKTPGYYANLEWMPDGRDLWDYCRKYKPTILTGLPLGKWAEPQKRKWCGRELGKEIPVICCMSRDKAKVAFEDCEEDHIPVLVDDRLKTKESWEEMGGIFVFHTNAQNSIEELTKLFHD
jgi:hypothetical protein